MTRSIADPPADAHRLLPEIRPRMAKADGSDIRKAETWRAQVGRAIDRVRTLCGLSLKEFADAIGRDERQVARWIAATERPQIDALFAVDALRQATVVAFAELAGEGVDVVTEIRVRRSTAS